jgi:hypothetical protein
MSGGGLSELKLGTTTRLCRLRTSSPADELCGTLERVSSRSGGGLSELGRGTASRLLHLATAAEVEELSSRLGSFFLHLAVTANEGLSDEAHASIVDLPLSHPRRGRWARQLWTWRTRDALLGLWWTRGALLLMIRRTLMLPESELGSEK